ncbi:MFS transporter [Microbulbifer hainanensis]|uniref:MFS transporter n=1 Tax=Microbulbifer hainanensis TaxID=2735675 RepID=UPI00186909D8|nr:MFS transporter [Microbulbifer hainanensis]
MSTTQVSPTDASGGQPQAAAGAVEFGPRLLTGLCGVLVATLAAGFNGNIIDIALADVRGAMSMGLDEGRWLSAWYQATQVAAMAFAPWFAVTVSLRRFTLFAIAGMLVLGIACPLAPDYTSLLVMRSVQGLMAGCLPPMLMTVALRFLPPSIKVYGLAAYALTATFGPNLGIALAALWTDFVGWRFLFWQVVPLGLLCLAAIAYGIPQDPVRLERFRQFDWVGLLTGFPGICALVLALLLGDWLDWFNSPFITGLLFSAGALLSVFFINEARHPAPFFALFILRRRNFSHALFTLSMFLVIATTSFALPSGYLAQVQGYRPLQMAPLSLLVALPQIVLLPIVAALCNRPWVDCRWLMGLGLAICALSLWLGSSLTSAWSRENFYLPMVLQMVGQPMVVVSILLSSTSVVHPMEGPVASAWFNSIKSFAAVLATSALSLLIRIRGQNHATTLADQLGNSPLVLQQLQQSAARGGEQVIAQLGQQVQEQAQVLASADIYQYMALLAVFLIALIPLVPQRVYPPGMAAKSK